MDKRVIMAEKDSIMHVVQQIDKLREKFAPQIKQGIIPKQNVLNAMVESMETVAQIMSDVLDTDSWKMFYKSMRESKVTDEFCDILLQWEQGVFDCISEVEMTTPICNLCKNVVEYGPAPNHWRIKQKEYGFKHWNAVFESISRRNRTCPHCMSMDRERMISLFLDMLKPSEGEKLHVLQIAPSSALDRWLKTLEYVNYDTTDLLMENVTFNADIQDMHMVANETYDIVVCSHILEHVENDQKAMYEIKRILKEEGVCIFLVPLVIGLNQTDEEFGLSEAENWRRFGQDDHARLYSREDFLGRLIQCGYLVHILDEKYFGKELWAQNGLSDIHCLYVATKKDIGIGIEPYRPKERKEELVSVIIPTYNRGYCIERAVRSVLNQTYQNIEVIVVDDASTDDTSLVIEKISDSRLRYIRVEKNQGANHARNVGVKEAVGEYIAFNDSDDEWLVDKLEKQMHLMLEPGNQEVGCVYCLITKYKDNVPISVEPNMEYCGEKAIGDIYHFMLGNMFISTQTLLLRKKAVEEAGYFNEGLKRLQDWELLLRISQRYKFTLVQESLVKGYVQNDSISKNTKGFVDTVRYAINLHNICQVNQEAYQRLIITSVNLMSQDKLPMEYKEAFIDQIKQDGFFDLEAVTKFRKILNIDSVGGEQKKSEEVLALMKKEINILEKRIDILEDITIKTERATQEVLWAQVFNNYRAACQWLPTDLPLWPGRWGVGYQYMYVVSRILNDVQPRRILETGLGQSTRLIGSYMKYYSEENDFEHIVIEHDLDWIDVFINDFAPCHKTNIIQRDIAKIKLGKDNNISSSTYIYMALNNILKGKKFDLISIDAPYGTNDPNGYSRIDILNYLPECLAESFCIVIDDYNRYGEKNTVECIKDILQRNQISFSEAVYRGEQDMYIIVSSDLKFLCTL